MHSLQCCQFSPLLIQFKFSHPEGLCVLQSQHNVLVVEAKQADLTREFTQLAVELIALDTWLESDEAILYGAVTTGDIWRFGSFHRQNRAVTQDLILYRVPTFLYQDVREIYK